MNSGFRNIVRRRNRRTRPASRRGNIVVLTAVMMIVLMFAVAFSIDMGYICVVRTELQRTVDSAALAGAGALYEPLESVQLYEYVAPLQIEAARRDARQFAQLNGAGRYVKSRSDDQLYVDLNPTNSPSGDIVLGRLNGPQFVASEVHPNAVQVQIRLTDQHENGPLTLFLGQMFGLDSAATSATATATVTSFPVLMPITTSVSHFESDEGTDLYSFEDGTVVEHLDGIPEIILYPGGWNGDGLPPGNFGAVQIGPTTGTTVLRQQIDSGPTLADFEHHGGSLYEGMQLIGKTGISSDIETAFSGGSADGLSYDGVIGKVRFIPLYSNVVGNGHNATFTIVRFVAVRIMYAELKSGTKRIAVQRVDDTSELAASIRLSR